MTDVALVVFDTMRADSFADHFDWLPGRRFENAWSTGNWSGPVHASLFTGLYPGEAGTYARNRTLDYPGPVLAERLSDAGYDTRMFSANGIVSPEFGFDRGFDTFEGSWNVELALTGGATYDWHTLLRDDQSLRTYLQGFRESITDDCETLPSLRRGLELVTGRQTLDYGAARAAELLGGADFEDDAFLFVNLMEAHAPYSPPPSYRTVTDYETSDHPLYDDPGDGSIDPTPIRQAYEDSVRYLSEVYRRLFPDLRESFDYVITLGDHGEMFGEHDFYQHTYGVYPQVTHVPLILSGDDVPDERRTETVSLLDVHRTIADLTGVPAEGRGQNLLDDPDSRPCLAEYRGIPHPRQVESLQDRGTSITDIRAYDEPLYSVALPNRAYGYQAPDGFHVRGDSPDVDPLTRLQELVADLDIREEGEDPADIPSTVVDRLGHIGHV